MDNTEADTVETPDPDEPKGLRKQLAEANSTIKDLRGKELDRVFTEVGLQTEKGLGKAIAKEYDGEITAQAVAEYAKAEYEWEGTTVSQHPEAQEIAQGQRALDAVAQGAGSVPLAPSEEQALASAETEQNYQKTLAMKGDTVASWFGKKP